jgi:hypothetical protein
MRSTLPLSLISSLLLVSGCNKAEPQNAKEASSKPTGATETGTPPVEDKVEAGKTPPAGDQAAPQEAEWLSYTGPGDSYTVKFPGKPTENEQKVPVEGGQEQNIKMALYEFDGGKRAFIASIVDVSLPEGATYDVHNGLKGAIEGMLGATGATKDSSTDITWGEAIGAELTYRGSAGGQSFKGIARVYATGGPKPRLWQFVAITQGEVGADERRFVEGAEVGIPKDGKPPEAAPTTVPPIADWVIHESADFRAKFPLKPTESEQPTQTELGEVKMTLASVGIGESAFMASATALGVPAGTEFDAAKAIDGAKAGIINTAGPDAKVVEKDVELNGMKGKDLRVEGKTDGGAGRPFVGAARFYLDEKGGKRIFTAVVVGETLPEEAVKAFLDSFEPK